MLFNVCAMPARANPDLYDSKGWPCLIVLKDGCVTDLTVGRYTGLESFLCDEDGDESIELTIYNYDQKAGPFSAKGDSRSFIFDVLGRMVGLLHSGGRKVAWPVPTSRMLPLPGGSWTASRRSSHTPTSTAPPGQGENNNVGLLLSHVQLAMGLFIRCIEYRTSDRR
jgi:hypothetical protein